MAHYGLLRDYRFSDDVDDIRGASLYGADNEKIGKVDDVVFDHATGGIQYAVVDAGGWLSTKKFLVPADRIRSSGKDDKDFSTDMTKDQIKSLPEYDEKAVNNDREWDAYQTRYRESIETGPVMHKENSTHIITPEPDELPATGEPLAGEDELEPQRLAGKFPDAAPESSKIRLRPTASAASEDASIPGTPLEPEIPTRLEEEALDRRQPTSAVSPQGRWGAFENHLRRNRVDITASCRTCGTAKDRVA
jgi:sporulation protein YlmC with PRC-barrel domain